MDVLDFESQRKRSIHVGAVRHEFERFFQIIRKFLENGVERAGAERRSVPFTPKDKNRQTLVKLD